MKRACFDEAALTCTDPPDEISMNRNDPSQPPVRETRLEREIERERNEHMQNHDAKAHLNFDDEGRHKDARATSFSSKVRR
jgi:hypothetical protein